MARYHSSSEEKPVEAAPVAKSHHSAFYPYPDSIPPEALTIVIDAFKGTPPDAKEGTHAIMHVISYGLGKWDTHDLTASHGPMSADDIVKALETLKTEGHGAAEAKLVLPWDIIIPALIKLLMDLFSK